MTNKRARSSSPELYPVEVLLSAQRTDKPRPTETDDSTRFALWEYFVKWDGWPDSANSWEPIESLAGCRRLLESFWRHVGDDSLDIHLPKFVVNASPEWVAEEKARAAVARTPPATPSALKRTERNSGPGGKAKTAAPKTPPKRTRRSPEKSAGSSPGQEPRPKLPKSPSSATNKTRAKTRLARREITDPIFSQPPLSPPPTPELEPVPVFYGDALVAPTEGAEPHFAPDDYTDPHTAGDVWLPNAEPAHDFGLEASTYPSFASDPDRGPTPVADFEFGDYILGLPPDAFLDSWSCSSS